MSDSVVAARTPGSFDTDDRAERADQTGLEPFAGRANAPKVGMACFLISECFFFGTLIVAYLTYLGKDLRGPAPAEVLDLKIPIAGTVALLLSSLSLHEALGSFRRGERGAFQGRMLVTIVLGYLFLVGTGVEWYRLIYKDGLTIGHNLFGTTYFTLVGFHAGHVTVGVILLSLVAELGGRPRTPLRPIAAELVGWYWHFVDAVWIVVFSVVYLLGR